MARVKIKQLGEKVATAGLHFGGGPERRKLEPGEVVDIPEDMLIPDGRKLLDVLWDTGTLELTLDAVTRPIDYQDYKEARFCSPSFKPRDASEESEMLYVRDKVKSRLQEQHAVAEEKPKAAGLDERPARKPTVKKGIPRTRHRPVVRKTGTHGTANTS